MLSPVAHPPTRADWFAARAQLATRRLRPFALLGTLTVVAAFGAVIVLRGPLGDRATAVQRAAAQRQATQRDTLALVAVIRAERAVLAARDSAIQALSVHTEQRATVLALPVRLQGAHDSLRTLVSLLDDALDRARKAPLASSYRVVAGMLSPEGGARALVDSLDALVRIRSTLDPATTPQSDVALLAQQTTDIGESLQDVALVRRAALVREMANIEKRAAAGTKLSSFAEDTTMAREAREARDSTWRAMVRAEASLRGARQWLVANAQQVDSAAHARATRILGSSPIATATAALALVGVLLFTLAVSAEARQPTIAHAREAERLTGVPVHAVIEGARLPREGRARLQPGPGIDPFNMVYLALTARGTREHTVCVTGDDSGTVAVVAGRLAVSSALDDRATLLVDLAPGVPAATRYFSERNEPGFTEAIAGVRLWREVLRPVGASETLGIDVVPAGARRHDTDESVAMETNRNEFHLVASEYDFIVIAAPTTKAMELAAVLSSKPATIYVARVAETTLHALSVELNGLRALDIDLYGILLVDWIGTKPRNRR